MSKKKSSNKRKSSDDEVSASAIGYLFAIIIIIAVIAEIVAFIQEHLFFISVGIVGVISLCFLGKYIKAKKRKQEELKRLKEAAELRKVQEEEFIRLQEEKIRKIKELNRSEELVRVKKDVGTKKVEEEEFIRLQEEQIRRRKELNRKEEIKRLNELIRLKEDAELQKAQEEEFIRLQVESEKITKLKKLQEEEDKRIAEFNRLEELRRLQEEEEYQRLQQEEQRKYMELAELEVFLLNQLGLSSWSHYDSDDYTITVKSRKALENYDELAFFKEDKTRIKVVDKALKERAEIERKLKNILANEEVKRHELYFYIAQRINNVLGGISTYKVRVNYISSANNLLGTNVLYINVSTITKYKENPELLMTKEEYSKLLKEKREQEKAQRELEKEKEKEKEKEELRKRQELFYSHVNYLVDYANENKQFLILKGSEEKVDELMLKLFDRTVNSIKKIKTVDSEEWDLIFTFIMQIRTEISEIMDRNTRVINYYNSEDFLKVRQSCETLINSQKDFNEYISEKVNSVASLFGTRVIRNETVSEDEYNYIRPYKKTITPFNAEVSAQVFASAENNPMEYIVKYFYPNKSEYKEQINKLYTLVEELETIKEAKQIIENYKLEYHQYLGNVPKYVLEEDEAGFYSRLGFANIDESVLAVEYKFSYTSGGGMAQRSFTVPMTEENIIELIKILESKLTKGAFVKEQRRLMTKKLRESIKMRDNYTCRYCGNSTYIEPNLLLEVDHIVPVVKGGCTVEDNLQTLCWKCNRSKGSKIV